MTALQEKASKDFNHTKAIGLRASGIRLNSLEGYSALSVKILEDFLKPEETQNLHFPPSDPMYAVIKHEHTEFELRCFDHACDLIEDYAGGYWVHSPDGILCRWAEPQQRFEMVNVLNHAEGVCNALEMGLVVTLMALDGAMQSENKAFAQAMIYFRSRLMQLIEEQAKDGDTVIDTEKVLRLAK